MIKSMIVFNYNIPGMVTPISSIVDLILPRDIMEE